MAELYTVNNQRTVQKSIPGGTFTRVVEVYFTAHPSEQTGIVEVPLTDYNPGNVEAAITPLANILNAVQAS